MRAPGSGSGELLWHHLKHQPIQQCIGRNAVVKSEQAVAKATEGMHFNELTVMNLHLPDLKTTFVIQR